MRVAVAERKEGGGSAVEETGRAAGVKEEGKGGWIGKRRRVGGLGEEAARCRGYRVTRRQGDARDE